MKILITGGTGFIGHIVCQNLAGQGHNLTVLSRNPSRVKTFCGPNTSAINSLTELTVERQFDAIINLAGEPIAEARWTPARKIILRKSRIGVTDELVNFISSAHIKPALLISGSAIGYYGNQDDICLDEHSGFVDDFSHQLCAAWEQSAQRAADFGTRVCILRTGLVIGPEGGFVQRMRAPFRLGLGGVIGNGRQWMSWIHRNDLVSMIGTMLNSKDANGIYNGTAPNPVTNREFTATLAKLLNRPAFLPVPAFALKVLLGEMSELLLGGQKVLPNRWTAENFSFRFTTLDSALKDTLNRQQTNHSSRQSIQ